MLMALGMRPLTPMAHSALSNSFFWIDEMPGVWKAQYIGHMSSKADDTPAKVSVSVWDDALETSSFEASCVAEAKIAATVSCIVEERLIDSRVSV